MGSTILNSCPAREKVHGRAIEPVCNGRSRFLGATRVHVPHFLASLRHGAPSVRALAQRALGMTTL